mmetsp:Transcript_13318/g.24503  ORF Transcript_13318/g.24503 Transcript_13318/m.24503 type:complete len:216 (+) Transcript_13318:258-905(+)
MPAKLAEEGTAPGSVGQVLQLFHGNKLGESLSCFLQVCSGQLACWHSGGAGKDPNLEVVHVLPMSTLAKLILACNVLSRQLSLENLHGFICSRPEKEVVVEIQIRLYQMDRLPQKNGVPEVIWADIRVVKFTLYRTCCPAGMFVVRCPFRTSREWTSLATHPVAICLLPIARRLRNKHFCNLCHLAHVGATCLVNVHHEEWFLHGRCRDGPLVCG